MNNVLEQITYVIADPEEHEKAQEKQMFERLANFILTLDPDQLNDDQLEETMDILELIDPGDVDFTMMEEYTQDDKERNKEYYKKNKGEYRKKKYPRADRTDPADKMQARVYKRKNRNKIRVKKIKLMRSAEGRKRMKMTDRLEKVHKTPTKRKAVRYSPVRKKRAKNRKYGMPVPKTLKGTKNSGKPVKKSKKEKTAAELNQEKFEKEILGKDPLKIKKAQEKAKALELKKKNKEMAKKKKQIAIKKQIEAEHKRKENVERKKRE